MVSDDKLMPMLTVTQVAKLLHIHTNTVRRWSDKGIIKAYRIARRGDRRFSPDDINNIIAQLKANNGYHT